MIRQIKVKDLCNELEKKLTDLVTQTIPFADTEKYFLSLQNTLWNGTIHNP